MGESKHWKWAPTYLGGRGFGVDIAVINLVLLDHLDINPNMERWSVI